MKSTISEPFDLNNPPPFDLHTLFSIDALVDTTTDFYTVIHRLPFGSYTKGGIFVIEDDFGPPPDTHGGRYAAFERKIADLWNGTVVQRPDGGNVACDHIIIPATELTVAEILGNMRKYSSLEHVTRVVAEYRYQDHRN